MSEFLFEGVASLLLLGFHIHFHTVLKACHQLIKNTCIHKQKTLNQCRSKLIMNGRYRFADKIQFCSKLDKLEYILLAGLTKLKYYQ
jgi:hypothetical protein